MKIESLGYKKAFTGEKMWHWKVEKGIDQFLVVANPLFLVMNWDKEGKFGNDDGFTEEEIENLKVKLGLNPKNRTEIEDDEDWNTLKGHFDERFMETEPDYVRESGK